MDSPNHEEIIRRAPLIDFGGDDGSAITPIRTETVLSRLPIHNLAKKGRVNIQIMKRNPEGAVTLQWEVSHSERYGPPRQVAYKLDTIVINRRIDEQGRPLPKMICLGSLRDIAEELGLGGNTNHVRRAIRQNAFAAITAKLTYRGTDGGERRLEADFTRYSVVFTGEELPDGRRADAVYIILNEPYREVLNNAPVRPLNYEYLKVLPPAAQRFYEVLSYRIFASLRTRNPEAKISYSDYCMFSAQQRYFDYNHFKKQMYKIHRLHVQSGYLQKVHYTATTDAQGNADWMMHYTPGVRARAEFRAFSAQHGKPNSLGANAAITNEVGEWSPETGSRQHPKHHGVTSSVKGIELVKYFHRRARGIDGYEIPANSKESAQADDLLTTYGSEEARFIVDYAIREAARTHFNVKFFGAVLQYIPEAMTAFNKKRSVMQSEEAWARAEAARKLETTRIYEKGKQVLAALAAEKRDALHTEVRAELLRRWPKAGEGGGGNQFLDRMVEHAMIKKLMSQTDGHEALSA